MKKLFTLMLLFSFLTIVAQDKIYVHTATVENSTGQVTYIDHPDLNNNPDAGIFFAHVWNPNGGSGVYNNNVSGLWYDGVNWTIFNEDPSVDIVEGSSYNIYIADPANVFTHISTAANQGALDSYTVIDDERFNNSNPGPYAIMSNYWNPNSVYNNYIYGFWYDASAERRNIYTEGGMPIPEGAAFKILANGAGDGVSRFTHEVSAENIVGNWTVIDHASLNGNPNATFVFSHFWGVNGAQTEVSQDVILGLWYDGNNWCIYREDATDAITVGMAYDIIVAEQTVVSVKEITLEAEVFVSPNPTTNFVTITTKDNISEIILYNNLGREFLRIEGVGNSMRIDLSEYSPGTYLAKVRVGDAIKTIKLIKQ